MYVLKKLKTNLKIHMSFKGTHYYKQVFFTFLYKFWSKVIKSASTYKNIFAFHNAGPFSHLIQIQSQ